MMMTDIVIDIDCSYGYNTLSAMDMVSEWPEQRRIFGQKFLELSSTNGKDNKSGAFWCKHNSSYVLSEDCLSADRMLCCVDDDKLAVVWCYIIRFYG